MKHSKLRTWTKAAITVALGIAALLPSAKPAAALERAAYLWNPAYDTDLSGSVGNGNGNWSAYKSWLGLSTMGASATNGFGKGDWWDCCQHVSWNAPWGTMTTRYPNALGDVMLGIGQMPFAPNYNGAYPPTSDPNQRAFEDQEWINEATGQGAATEMGYFKNYVDELHSNGFRANSVIIRIGWEFDGPWNPWGGLDKMTNMTGSTPATNNYIKAWQNIVTAMRNEDNTYSTHVLKGFCWNPTDGNVGAINQWNFYPGDGYVDYIGIDEYDYDYNGDYSQGVNPQTQQQQTNAWNNVEVKRLNNVDNFASSSYTRPNSSPGVSKQMIFCEWGLWQIADPNNPKGSDRPAGGDNPSYIQNMYNWMNSHNVYMETYFETPADGVSSLWDPIAPNGKTSYPNAQATYKSLFGSSGGSSSGFTNPGFEAGNLSGWSTWVGASNNGAAAFAQNAGSSAHSGNWEYTDWSSSPYELTTYQTISLPNGLHTVSAWIKSSGGQSACRMETSGYGGNTVYTNIGASSGWTQISATVNVTTGTLTVGFYSNAAGNQWLNFDDVALDANAIVNPSFETGNLSGWNLWVGSNGAACFASNGSGEAHSGSWGCDDWSTSPYEETLYQSVNVPNGNHTISAWVKSSGGQAACQMMVRYYNGSSSNTTVNIPAASVWTQISTTVNVTSGTLEVSFYNKAAGNQWMNLDDVAVN